MMRRAWRPFVVALLLAGCEPAPLREMKAAAVRSLRVTANEPETVQVESLVIIGRHQVCGRVQQKNAMGGYTGWRPFYSRDSTAMVAGRDITFNEVDAMCIRKNEDAERYLRKFKNGQG